MVLLSIIIPVYNVEAYIERCFDSLLEQVPWEEAEVICVDDGSTDRSGAICDAWARRYPHMTVIHQANRGVGAARNAGFAASRGTYIAWVDPDDYVEDCWYASIRSAILDLAPDMLVIDYTLLRGRQRLGKDYAAESGWLDPGRFLWDVVEDVRVQSQMWQKVCRRELFRGIPFPEDVPCLEDYSILHRLILRARRIYYLHRRLYMYRVRDHSLVTDGSVPKSYQCFLIARERYNYLIARGYNVPCMGMVRQALGCCQNYYKAADRKAYGAIYGEMRHCIRHNIRSVVSCHMPLRFPAALCVVLSGAGPTIFRSYRKLKDWKEGRD